MRVRYCIRFIVLVIVREVVAKLLLSTVCWLMWLALIWVVLVAVPLIVTLILTTLISSVSFMVRSLGILIAYVVVLVHLLPEEVNYLNLLYPA